MMKYYLWYTVYTVYKIPIFHKHFLTINFSYTSMSVSIYLDVDDSSYLYPDSILDDIINGDLDEDKCNTLIDHGFRMERKEKFWITREDMGYYFRISKETEGLQT